MLAYFLGFFLVIFLFIFSFIIKRKFGKTTAYKLIRAVLILLVVLGFVALMYLAGISLASMWGKS